jgi:hypothetical protein
VHYTTPLVLAVLVVGYAVVSERVNRSYVAPALIFLLLGMGLGPFGLHVLDAGPGTEGYTVLAQLALTVILFNQAANLNFDRIRLHGRVTLRLLIVGVPLTVVLAALTAAMLLPVLPWWEAVCLAAVVAPTEVALIEALPPGVPLHRAGASRPVLLTSDAAIATEVAAAGDALRALDAAGSDAVRAFAFRQRPRSGDREQPSHGSQRGSRKRTSAARTHGGSPDSRSERHRWRPGRADRRRRRTGRNQHRHHAGTHGHGHPFFQRRVNGIIFGPADVDLDTLVTVEPT